MNMRAKSIVLENYQSAMCGANCFSFFQQSLTSFLCPNTEMNIIYGMQTAFNIHIFILYAN